MLEFFTDVSRRPARLGLALMLVFVAACARVSPHLELPALDVTQPSFAATLGAYTGTSVVGGNRVGILLNGEEIFPAKLAAIRKARRTITYAQYVFEDGKPARDIASARGALPCGCEGQRVARRGGHARHAARASRRDD